MAGSVFVTLVCPLLGNILGVVMLLSPIPAILNMRKTKSLGALNPLPWPLTVLNCIGWIAYGIVTNNPLIPPGNIVGAVAGLYFTVEAIAVVDKKKQDLLGGILVVGMAYFCLISCVGAFALPLVEAQRMWSYQSVIILLAFYSIPLSSMWEVIKTKNAASIYMPLAVAVVANGSMWLPNGIGALLGLLQVGLRLTYPPPPFSLPIGHADASVDITAASIHQHSKDPEQGGTPKMPKTTSMGSINGHVEMGSFTSRGDSNSSVGLLSDHFHQDYNSLPSKLGPGYRAN